MNEYNNLEQMQYIVIHPTKHVQHLIFSDEFEHVCLTTGATGREKEVFVVATLLKSRLASAVYVSSAVCCVS
jgi:hypothetical protein